LKKGLRSVRERDLLEVLAGLLRDQTLSILVERCSRKKMRGKRESFGFAGLDLRFGLPGSK
jgi:hypothetical protein